MPKQYPLIAAFNGGEVSPLMEGRADLGEKYTKFLKKCENYLLTPQGPAIFRSGLKYIADTKNGATEKSRLIPFRYSDEESYVLEFGDLYIRIYRNDGQVEAPDTEIKLLIHANEANGTAGTNIDDASESNHTLIAKGNAKTDESQKKFGNASLYFDGTQDWIETPDHADFDFTGNDWNIACFVRPLQGNSQDYMIFAQDMNADTDDYLKFYLTWYTGLLLNGYSDGINKVAKNYSTTIGDSSMNTKTLTRDGATSLLLHGIDSSFNETDGSQDIFDSSPTGHTITVNGDAKISTDQAKFGGSSIYFDGTGDYLTLAFHADFDFSSNICTIEFWIYNNGGSSGNEYIFFMSDGGLTDVFQILLNNNRKRIEAFMANTGGTQRMVLTSSDNSVPTDTWTHVAFVSDAANGFELFINGTSEDTYPYTGLNDFEASYTDPIAIGIRYYDASYPLDAYIDDFTAYKGLAKYTSNFIPLTRRNAAGEITTESSKFGDGAISFTGADYLTHAGSSDFDIGATGSSRVFTWEAQVNPDSLDPLGWLFYLVQDTNNYLLIYHKTDGTIKAVHQADAGSTDTVTSTSSLSVGSYSHVAVVSDGTTLAVFIDGTREDTATLTGGEIINDASNDPVYIGGRPFGSGVRGFRGLLDDVKFSLNERYDVSTATLTVPLAEDRNICHAKFEIDDSTTNETLEGSDDNITPDAFHHIEVGEDFSDTDRFLMTDGVLDAVDTSFAVNTDDLDGKIYIGIDPNESSSDYKGWIDELIVYNYDGAGSVLHDAGGNSVGDQIFPPPTAEYGISGDGTAEEVTTTYTEDQLFEIKYAQSADVLYLAHPDHTPRKLVRLAENNWVIQDIAFYPPPVTTNIVSPAYNLTLDSAAVGDSAGGARTFTDLGAAGTLWKSGDIGREIREKIGYGTGRALIKTVTSADAVECDVFVAFSSTTLNSGEWEVVGSPGSEALTLGQTTLIVGDVTTLTPAVNEVFTSNDVGKYIEIYEEVGGTLTPTLLKIMSVDASTPKVATCSATESITFDANSIAAGDWDILDVMWDSTKGFPRAVTFYENRLLWGGTVKYPQTIFGSKVDDYENHKTGTSDEDAYQYTLAGREVNTIIWMEDGVNLFIGTAGAEWALGSRNVLEPVTPSNVDARVQTSKGSYDIQPIKIGQRVLYIQKGGSKINELIFDFGVDKYVSNDLMVFAEHILEDGIIDFAYQEEPYKTLWCVRADGQLVGLTYLKEQEVIAWHRHTTAFNGEFESVAVIPGNVHDDVWVIVKRTINGSTKRFVERMVDVFASDDITDGNCLDASVEYTTGGAKSSISSGLTHLEGETVDIIGDGILLDSQTVSSGTVSLKSGNVATSATKVYVGKKYTGTLQLMRLDSGSVDGTAQARVKKITKLGIRFYRSYNALVGPSETDTDRIDFDSGELFTGDKVDIDYPEGYETDGNITIIQDRPFPQTIVAVMPDVDTKGF